MKKVILLTTVMLFGASLAFGQGGVIGTYADAEAIECNVTDAGPGLLSIFVVHTLAQSTGSRFMAAAPLCMVGAVWLSDTVPQGVGLGGSQTGIAIGYGSCLAPPIHALTINYFANGLTALCCAYAITPDPGSDTQQIESIECITNNLLIASGRVNTVNGTVSQCPCAVPVEETTWGQVKALYNVE